MASAHGTARAHGMAGARSWPPTTASLPAARRLLSQDSPTGQHRAVLSRCSRQGHELLEVWGSGGRSHSVDLTALGKHGEVYTEGPFACLAWSHSEMRLLYVAEKSRPKPRPPCPWDVPGAGRLAEEDEDEEVGAVCPGEQFVYREDWGEALSTRSVPVLCVLDLEGSSLSVLEGIPEHLSPGQALWSPDDRGVVFVGWWHEPFRLGLRACSNRRSGIFHLDLASGCCELLSAERSAACSPRLSPDGRRLLYLEGGLGGPHRQCLRLCMLTWQTRQTVTVLDVVQEPTEAFAGVYTEVLPPRCWAADSRRAVVGTPQRSRTDLLLVDTEAATVTNLTAGGGSAATGRPGAAPLLGACGGHPNSAWCHLEDPDDPATLQWADPSHARLLWYPEGGHALAGVETEADVFGNCARWLLQHLGQPRRDGTGQHSP
ncbi:acylamino-acid-releasing enzyme-like [Limosa lapponica baueri]|uniref:Acylamino-acid-releasing enzyme-like n=1 Tax=Limosa lapponica baueri TaxID=1758121 RepID=A0A2I0THG8_LIMLA|nr:acylamino-acid-releasing enzyme-like [Limosa lapponica baueri]